MAQIKGNSVFERDKEDTKKKIQAGAAKSSGSSGSSSSAKKTTGSAPANAYSDSGSYQRAQTAKQNRTTGSSQGSGSGSRRSGSGSSSSGSGVKKSTSGAPSVTNYRTDASSSAYNNDGSRKSSYGSSSSGSSGGNTYGPSKQSRELSLERAEHIDVQKRESSVRRRAEYNRRDQALRDQGIDPDDLRRQMADYLNRSDPELSSRLAGSYAGNVQSIVNSLSRNSYKNADDIQELQDAYARAQAELDKLKLRGYDVTDAQKTLTDLRKSMREQISYNSTFKNKYEYNAAQFMNEQKGKSYKEIQEQIDVRSRRLGNEGQNMSPEKLTEQKTQLNWLEQNKYNYMTRQEQLAELKKTYEERAQEAPDLKERFRTGDVSKHTGNRADYDYKIERLQDALKNSSDKSSLPERLWNDSDISTGGAVTWRDRLKYAEQDYERFASSLNLQRSDDKALSKLMSDKNKYVYRDGNGMLRKGTAEELLKEYVTRQDYQASTVENAIIYKDGSGAPTPEFIRVTGSIAEALSKAGYDVKGTASAYERYRNEQAAKDREEQIRSFAREHSVLASAESIASNIVGGAAAALGTLGRASTAGAYDNTRAVADVNASEFAVQQFTTDVRDEVAKKLSENAKTSFGKQFISELYSAGMSFADMATEMAIAAGSLAAGGTPVKEILKKGTSANKAADRIVKAIMGSSAGTSGFIKSVKNGNSIQQSLATGLLAGAFEVLYEEVSIGNLFESLQMGKWGELVLRTPLAMLGEASEELFTEGSNILADVLINGSNSEFNRSVIDYMKNGYSAAAAKSMATLDTAKQIGWAGFGGALGAGFDTAITGSVSVAGRNIYAAQKRKADIDTGRDAARAQSGARSSENAGKTIENLRELTGEAKLSEKEQKKIDSDIRKAEKAQAKIESREQDGKKKAVTKKSAYDIGKAVNDVRELSAESAVSSIRKNAIADRITQLDKDGRLNAQNVDALANAVYEAYVDEKNGKRTSRENISLITNSPVATTVRNELRSAESQRASQWIQDMRNTERAAREEIDERAESGVRSAEIQPVGEFAAKTINGEAVTVTAIENTRNGIKVRLSDRTNGIISEQRTANSEQSRKGDVFFDNEEDEKLFVAAARAGGAAEANAFISAYQPGIDIAEYTREWNEAYTAGLLGRTETVDPSTASRSPSPWQGRLDAAYQAGVERRNSGRIDPAEIAGQIVRAAGNTPGVTVLAKGGEQALSEADRQTLRLADAYGKAHGIRYIVVDAISGGRANAVYAGGNVVFVAADIGNADGGMSAAIGHDTWHYITETIRNSGDENAEQYVTDKTAELLGLLKGLDGYDYDARREAIREANRKLGEDLTKDRLDEEQVGNGMFELITNDEAVRSLAESDAKNGTNFIQWIREALETVVQRIRESAARYGVAEARALVNVEEALAKFNEVGNEAIRLADQARQSSTAHRAVNDQNVISEQQTVNSEQEYEDEYDEDYDEEYEEEEDDDDDVDFEDSPIWSIERNHRGAWVIYGTEGVKQYYDMSKAEAKRRYTAEVKSIVSDAEDNYDDDSGMKYMAREDTDRDYLVAVKSGDMTTAQRMVDEAAREAGYDSPRLYHGTAAFGFTEFDLARGEHTIFATNSRDVAETYVGKTERSRISERSKLNVDALSGEALLAEGRKLFDYLWDYELMTDEDRERLIRETREGLRKTMIKGKEFVYLFDGGFDESKLKIVNTMNDALTRLAEAQTKDEIQEAWNIWDSSMWDFKFTDESLSYEYLDAVNRESLYKMERKLEDLLYEYDLYKSKHGDKYIFDNQIALELDAALHKGVYELYGKTGKAFDFDAKGSNWNNIKLPGPYTKENTELTRAEEGYYLTDKETGKIIYKHEGWSDNITGKSISELSEDVLKTVGLINANASFGIKSHPMTTREVAEYAFGRGYDSVILRNLRDVGGATGYSRAADIYIFNAENSVKSADPVTYDDEGNVIPLSERFGEKKDLRFMARENGKKDVARKKRKSVKWGDMIAVTYNDSPINWVYENKLFTNADKNKFYSQISDINQGYKLTQLTNGDYFLQLNTCYVVTNGDYDEPKIKILCKIGRKNLFEKIWRYLNDGSGASRTDKGYPGRLESAIDYVASVYSEKSFRVYRQQDYSKDANDQVVQRENPDDGRTNQLAGRTGDDRRGVSEEAGETEINSSGEKFMARESDYYLPEDEEETPYNGEKDFRLTERYREALTGMGYDRTDDQIVRMDPESEAGENRGNVPAYNKYPPRDEQTRRAMDRISKTSRPNPRDMEKVASSFDQADTNRMKADKEIVNILSALYRYASVGNEELSSDEYGQSLIDMAYMAAKAIVSVNSSYGAYTGGDPKGFYLDRFANDLLNDVLLINGNVIARGEFGMVPASELDSARREYESARKQDQKEIERLTRKNEETEKRFGEYAATEKKRDAQRRLDADKALREALRNNKKIERSRAGIKATSEKRKQKVSELNEKLKQTKKSADKHRAEADRQKRRADIAEATADLLDQELRPLRKKAAKFGDAANAVYNAVQAERRQAVRERATQKTLQNVTKLRKAVSNTRYEMPESITSLTNTVLDMFDGNSLMMPEDLQHTVASVMTAVQELALPEDGDIYRGLIEDITSATEAMSRMPQLYEMSAMAPRAYDETAAATNAEKYEDAVNTMVTATEHIVRRFNAQAKFMAKITQEVQKDINPKKFGEMGKVKSALDTLDSMISAAFRRAVTEEPYVARRIGGTFADLMDDFRRNGEKQYWDYVFAARDKLNDILDKYDARNIVDGKSKDRITFTTHEGKKLTLEITQAMGVYATWLRERANVDENGKRRTAHLELGGIMFKGDKMADGTKVPQSTGKFRLNDADMRTIQEFLNKDGRNMTGLVKDVVKYMTETVGEWGNQASLKMYGVRKFTDPMYYPFESAEKSTIARAKEDVSGEQGSGKRTMQKFSNQGMSKEVMADAMTPVYADNFFEAVAKHINSVSAYGAYAEGQQNLLWILSYRVGATETETGSVFSEYLDDAYGRGMSAWIHRWLSDMSGNQVKDSGFGAILFSRSKGAMVAANMSVTLKQPTSIGRALAYLGPQYFLGNPFNAGGIRTDRNAYNEALKYSGAAKSKLAGGSFDLNDGRTAAEFMLLKPGKRVNNLQDLTGLGARVADEVTWGNIWNACKRWTRRNMPALSGEEFMRQTASKFDEVIQMTQVYDEQMIKSELMRSQNAFNKMITMFMSEPIKQMNMFADAGHMVEKNPKSKEAWKYFARTNGALLVQALLTAAATGLVRAFREKDDDKELPERIVMGILGGGIEELNPLNKIPFIKDILSKLDGYDVTRGDMELLDDLFNYSGKLFKLLENDEKYAGLDAKEKAWIYADAIASFTGAITAFFGLPVSNVYRDVTGLVRSAPKVLTVGNESVERMTWALKEELRDAFTVHLGDRFERSAFDFLIPTAGEIGESLLAGDTKKAEEQMTELASYLAYTGDDKTTQTIRSKLYDIVKKYVEDGQIDDDTARDYVYKYLAHKAKSDGTQQTYTEDEAYWLVKKWHFLKEHPDEQFREYNDLDKAIDQKADLTDAINELTAHGFTEAQADQRVYNHLKNRFDNGEISADEARDLLEFYAEYAHNKKTTGKMAEFETQKDLGKLTEEEYNELLKLYGQDADYLDPLHYARQKVEEWSVKKETGSYSMYAELDDAIQNDKSTAKAVEHLEWLGVRESSIKKAASTGLNIAVNKYFAEQIADTGTSAAQRAAAAAKTGKYAEELYLKYVSDNKTDAWEKGIKTEYKLNHPEYSGDSVYIKLRDALTSGTNAGETMDDYLDHGKLPKSIFNSALYPSYYTQYCMAYQKGDTATMGAIYSELVQWSDKLDYSSSKNISYALTKWRGKVDDGTWKESSDYDPEYKYERRR